MFGTPLAALALLCALAALLAHRAGGRPPSNGALPPGAAAVRAEVFALVMRFCVGGCASLATLAVLIGLHAREPGWLGLPLAIAPAAAGLVFLVVYCVLFAARRPARPRDAVTTASLSARTASSVGGARPLLTALLPAAAVVALLAHTTATASPDELGLMRNVSPVPGSSRGPYPGSYYSAPLLTLMLLVVIATVCALWLIARRPSLQGNGWEAADAAWRAGLATCVGEVVGGGLMLQFAGLGVFSILLIVPRPEIAAGALVAVACGGVYLVASGFIRCGRLVRRTLDAASGVTYAAGLPAAPKAPTGPAASDTPARHA
ncbi:hypothetical protein JT358_00320 [Micrococcales bacterium 31B]|nr:hypothetical protein [Micrococcales bacterium 31B]